jgi:predicted GNAT family acetyltransferase
MDIDTTKLLVVLNETHHRFEITYDGAIAQIAFRREPGRIVYIHTEVPEAFEGQGIAGQMAKVALDYARKHGLQVVPQCPYVQAYIKRHAEYQDLVAAS